MSLEAELGRELHGELLGGAGMIFCDYATDGCAPLDHTESICYEAIRVVTSPTFDDLPIPSEWVLDAARCPIHASSTLPCPTKGFDEVLLTLEAEPVENGMFAVVGQSVQVLDVSLADEGVDPVVAPEAATTRALGQLDYGFDRLGRQARLLTARVRRAFPDFATAVDEATARDPRGQPSARDADPARRFDRFGSDPSSAVDYQQEALDWLPARPITSEEALDFKRTESIVDAAPILGVGPDPEASVILLYLWVNNQMIWAIYHPDELAWKRFAAGPVRETVLDMDGVLADARALLDLAYPGEDLTVLREKGAFRLT